MTLFEALGDRPPVDGWLRSEKGRNDMISSARERIANGERVPVLLVQMRADERFGLALLPPERLALFNELAFEAKAAHERLSRANQAENSIIAAIKNSTQPI